MPPPATLPRAAPAISAVLIARDAGPRLAATLASLAWADEIVLLDSGSLDGTPELARRLGATVHSSRDTPWPGFGPQRNRAARLAAHDWVFFIDADETCPPPLAQALRAFATDPGPAVAASMARRSAFCGHWMDHGGWWPDRVTRLYDRRQARYSDDPVHERLLADGPVHALPAPRRWRPGALALDHYTYDTPEQALDKLNRYSSLSARLLVARGRTATPFTAGLRGGWAFFRSYVLRGGFLGGGPGLMLARYLAAGAYWKHLKVWLLRQPGPVALSPPPAADTRDALAETDTETAPDAPTWSASSLAPAAPRPDPR